MATDRQRAWNASSPGLRPLHLSRPKLTPAQRAEIRQRLTDGERAVDLAAEYGVSRGCINHCR
ncbi:Hin recombinase [Streptomyces sp. NPDC052015]|uniref:Hin recombinase n=1 Tax=Streptomyces sp. NPDC052015 TaxID=3154755 RepID=UPI003444ED8F